MASLPRFDPSRFSATHPSGVKTPQRPHTRFRRNALRRAIPFSTARKSVTVARLGPEKKGRGKRGFYGSMFRAFLLSLNCTEIIRNALKRNALSVENTSDMYYN